jgi:stage III sporulation protein SpoIIIAA
MERLEDLLEVVMDLGREPEARFPGKEVILSHEEVTQDDLEYVVSRIGEFGDDNRAGIPRTLHRISAIRNRKGKIVGLTCRVGRAVFGTMDIIRDIVESGKSILILGKPGVGKTTLLREVARVLADDFQKRVIIVDTSNEIAGDGDIPHPGIGRARRMQVPTPTQQHAVMIEAVENHMPEVIVIDEIGTELEAEAARTIAERGVQLVGTAHGNTLENLMMNPTLSDLVGGIQPVTLGDEEARRRGTQKTVLERKAPPTFDVLVEMQDRQRVAVHRDVAETIDALLRGQPVAVEVRWRQEDGKIERRLELLSRFGVGEERGRRAAARGRPTDEEAEFARAERVERGAWSERAERAGRAERGFLAGHRATWGERGGMPAGWSSDERVRGATALAVPEAAREEAGARVARSSPPALRPMKLYPFGVNRDRLEAAIAALRVPVTITKDVREADAVITLKNYYRRNAGPVREAEEAGKPVLVLRSNTVLQMTQSLEALYGLSTAEPRREIENLILQETEDAINHVLRTSQDVELPPQNAYIRRLQHELAEQFNVGSRSMGREPHRRVRLFKR